MIGFGSVDMRVMADDVQMAFRAKGFRVWADEFVYATDRIAMPGDATLQPRVIRFDPDSYFVHLANAVSIRNAAGVEGFAPTIGIQIRDADCGFCFSDDQAGPIPAQLQAGSASQPYILAAPYVWQPGGRALVTFRTLNIGASRATIQLCLWGLKLFTRPFTKQSFDKVGFAEH